MKFGLFQWVIDWLITGLNSPKNSKNKMNNSRAELVFSERSQGSGLSRRYVLEAKINHAGGVYFVAEHYKNSESSFVYFLARVIARKAKLLNVDGLELYRGDARSRLSCWKEESFLSELAKELRIERVGLEVVDLNRPSLEGEDLCLSRVETGRKIEDAVRLSPEGIDALMRLDPSDSIFVSIRENERSYFGQSLSRRGYSFNFCGGYNVLEVRKKDG